MKMILLCGLLWLLTGCTDPLGATTRTQIRANAIVDADQVKAVNDRLAREAEAHALVDAERARQDGLNQRNANWVMVAPFLLLIIGAGSCVTLIIHWSGKIAYERTCQRAFSIPDTPPALPYHVTVMLAQKGCIAEHDRGNWWVVHQSTGRRLPQPITHLLEVRQ